MPTPETEVIELELDDDGVYKEKIGQKKVTRRRRSKKEKTQLSCDVRQEYPMDPVEKFMQGFEIGASVIERIANALRKI